MKTMNTRLTIFLAAFVLSLGLAAPAMAQTGDGYSEEGAVAETQTGGPNGGGPTGGGKNVRATGTANASGNLPFSGLDLGLIAGSGVLLLGAGVGMRLLTRGAQPRQQSAG